MTEVKVRLNSTASGCKSVKPAASAALQFMGSFSVFLKGHNVFLCSAEPQILFHIIYLNIDVYQNKFFF